GSELARDLLTSLRQAHSEEILLPPTLAEEHLNRGLAYVEQGRLDEAIREFQAALRTSQDYAKAHYVLGLAYEQQG
ncbi:unnamed protein product, partial [marine sediment metagenome]